MKYLLPVLLLLLPCARSTAQSVVYVCNQTGSYGVGYNAESSPMKVKECQEKARKDCEKYGGKSCKVYKEVTTAGWYSFGIQPSAPYLCAWGTGSTEAEAYADMIVNYTLDGGKNCSSLDHKEWKALASGK